MNIPTRRSPGKISEAPRSVGGRIQRKPLADCTNIVSRSSRQQPSSSLKFANPSLTSSLKRLVDQTTLKEKPKDVVINSETASEKASPSPAPATNVRPVTRRMSADLGGSPASAPSRPQSSRSDLGVSDTEFAEPWSVYTVRRKRNKDASTSPSSAAARMRLDLTSSAGKKTCQADVNKTKPLKMAPKKRQRTVKQENENLVHAATREYIEQQKAYFAEIDAFELPVEDASSSDSD
ncbi:PREDICTED: uncharacterized protein LOC104791923 [Camelina sativa]|uniref:Uncharacterized protein LOC104791923 n=1 Tax=Camelina sativa TaxID=90675 RepID=A0ABM0ZIJ9_CAMSA|nr:PREDICTED: uncharacterized protein LOC104791923 [Camelina sativa]